MMPILIFTFAVASAIQFATGCYIGGAIDGFVALIIGALLASELCEG